MEDTQISEYYTGRNIRNYGDQKEDGLTIGTSLSGINPR
jgi:hypothetical protein